MSLVTTATDQLEARERQRAATRAVLPLPTGPPMPTRSGLAGSEPGAASDLGAGSEPRPSECTWASGGKETHLPRRVGFSPDLDKDRRAGRQLGNRVGKTG